MAATEEVFPTVATTEHFPKRLRFPLHHQPLLFNKCSGFLIRWDNTYDVSSNTVLCRVAMVGPLYINDICSIHWCVAESGCTKEDERKGICCV